MQRNDHAPAAVLFLALATALALAGPPRRGDFPGYGILPKEDTGADRFLRQYPEYDGRGVIVAIFDTGVDPGAPGLQLTSTGQPKIVDLVDGSGAGDVDTTTVVEVQDGAVTGLSGRPLTIPPGWNNPTGKYHLGLKRAYEIYPGGLVGRLKDKRREKWDEQQRAAVTTLERQRAEWDAAHPSPSADQCKEHAELEARLEQLNALAEKYDDPGPVFDCLVFHDGQVWRAAIDTDEDGDLADEKVLTNFRLERQYATFGSEDLLNYALNIYDGGDLLSIVADDGAHGTHVAGIVAAYFPDQPELNGIAPGAQLVAVKIGDNRLDSNSCATGEIRGCIAVLQNKCDLINQSFGEPSADPDHGRNCEIYSEMVNKHGVIYVSSAGNEGPALSTVGYPGGSTEALLGIGASISPDMMEMQYALRERVPATFYTWTSRGPTYDGALGVKFSAPGGAIAPVPNWVLQRNMQMNGTSMASPNACGNIALLLSALKSEPQDSALKSEPRDSSRAARFPYSPHRIRRALENTAQPVPGVDIFGQGRGVIQVDRAYEYLTKFASYADQDLRYDVRVPARDNGRGIYLREPYETEQPLETAVSVTPFFHEDADNRDKVNFELRVTLESTERWVECADHLVLMHGGRRFTIKVDPTRLPAGLHYAEIRGYDSASPERGPLFRLPITVIRPLRVDSHESREAPRTEECQWRDSLAFTPGHVERRFLAVPAGATWADVRVQRRDEGEPRTIIVHTSELVPGQRSDDYEFQEYLRLGTGGDEVRSFKVMPGRTLEVCLAQYWSSLGPCQCEVEVTFHGVVPDRDVLTLQGGEIATQMTIETPLRSERVAPQGTLNTLRQTIRPSDYVIRPLDGERDRLPEERQIHELVLTYEFKLDADVSVTPRAAIADIVELQEGWQSSLYIIFDSSKRVVARWGLAPKAVSLSKGDYVLRFHLRHDDREQLDKVKDMALLLDRALSSAVNLQFYADPDDALAGAGKFNARTLSKGARAVLWVTAAAEKLPKAAQPGTVLLGSVNFADGADNLPGAGKRPGGHAVVYVVAPKPVEKKEPEAAEANEKDEKSESDKLAEAVRDVKVAQLAKLRGEENRELFDRVAAEILKEYPNYLPALVEQLKRADGKKRADDLAGVVAAAERLSAPIDQEKLAAHYGVKLDPDDKEAAKVRKEMDKQKAVLVDALHRKAKALFDQAAKSEPRDASRADDDPAADTFEKAFAELQKWVDTTEGDYLTLHMDREVRHGRLGEALKLLNKKIADSKPDQELLAKRIKLLDELGWQHGKRYEESWQLIRFPAAYPPF